MTLVIWLLLWLANGAPGLHAWNVWAVSLLALIVVELAGSGRSS